LQAFSPLFVFALDKLNTAKEHNPGALMSYALERSSDPG
jgi:hypothetical protein